MTFAKAFCRFVAFTATALVPASANAVPTAYTNRTDWENAILAVDAIAQFDIEDFNNEPVTFVPGTNNGIDEGPHSYGAGAVELSLTGIGDAGTAPEFGGSQSGVLNPGDFDGTNALELRLVVDSADFDLFPGFPLDGEGVEQADVSFSSLVLGFAGEWTNTNNQDDGVDVTINGVLFNTLSLLPNDNLNSGSGFLGFVDPFGIAAFSMVVGDNPLDDPESFFEQIQIDSFEWATGVIVPEPSTFVLAIVGFIGLFAFRRRRRR